MGRSKIDSTVRGTIEDPPIIVEQDRAIYFEGLAFPLLTVAWLSQTAAGGASIGVLALIVFFGLLVTGISAYKFFRPNMLQLSADGVVARRGLGSVCALQWRDFSHFDRDFGDTNSVFGVFADANSQGRLSDDSYPMASFATEAQSIDFLNLVRAAHAKWGGDARSRGSHVEATMSD